MHDRNINTTSDIPILYAGNDEYTIPLTVSMVSACIHQHKHTHLSIKILMREGITEDNIKILKSISNYYPHCSVDIIIVNKDLFLDASKKTDVPLPTYYVLIASSRFPNLDKMLYFDGDVLIFSDLNNMYNFNISDVYYAGSTDPYYRTPGKRLYINAGILSLNLKLMRENNYEDQVFEYIKTHNYINKADNTIINTIVPDDKMKLLPPELSSRGFESLNALKIFYYHGSSDLINYNFSDFEKSWRNPKIVHICGIRRKPFAFCFTDSDRCNRKYLNNYLVTWWDYAEIHDDYYELVLKKICRK